MSANSKLGEQLITLHRQKFTGILTITSQDEKKWEMFFYLGKYLWADGGYQINRSWRRNFSYYLPKVDTSSIVLRNRGEAHAPRSSKHYLIHVLLQRKLVTTEQVKALINNRNQEILFDLLQKEYHDSLNYNLQATSPHYLLKAGFSLSLDFLNLEQMLFKSQTAWSTWGSKGLASCSPHHAPLLNKYDELKQQVPDIILSNMSRLLNGKSTLRDLAIKMDKDILDVTCGLVPYFFKGYLRFLEIPDLSHF
ncbi:MAG: DUF4388 domain-containing protein [Waterburya sp.]